MDDKHKPLKVAADKVKDIYNTYRRGEERTETQDTRHTVHATTSNDINEVHEHQEPPEPSVEVVEKAVHDTVKDQLLRKIAEFENYKRRTEREKEQLALYATEKMFSSLIEVLDDLHAALEAGRKSHDYQSMLSGLELIYTKAHKIYEEHGVSPLIAEEGSIFNVDQHEALMHIPHPEIPEGQVVQQIQRGYTLRDKILRHAKVVTSAGSPESDNENAAE